MKNNKLINNNYKRGQSLIEIVISVSIIVTVIIAVLGLVTNLLVISSSVKYRNQASFLAQEGQEIVHNIRDTNKLKLRSPWDSKFFSDGSEWYKIKYPYSSTEGWELESKVSENEANEVISLDGFDFTRTIKVIKYSGAEDKREVIVKVTWPERNGTNKVEVSGILVDWDSFSVVGSPTPPAIVLVDSFDSVSPDWELTRTGGSTNSLLASTGSYLYANYGTAVSGVWYGISGTRTIPTSPIAGDFEVVFNSVTVPLNNPSGAMGQLSIELLNDSGSSMYTWFLNDAWTADGSGADLFWQNNGPIVLQEYDNQVFSYDNDIKFKKNGSTIYFYKDNNQVYSGSAAASPLSQIRVTFNAYSTYPTYGGNLKIGGLTVVKY